MESSNHKIIVDTNFLMMMIQLNIDVIEELKIIAPSNYDLVVPSIVLDEIDSLKRKAKGKDKIAANVARKIATQKPFINTHIDKTDHVDNLLLDYCSSNDVICTNDKTLRKRARKRGITVIYLRQHRFLEVDGYINKSYD
ncbi:MAG: PIN domain-containing protein [Methanosphaera sp.]|nr:PIN domain-containing protein [Methanosphaera sp.]